MRPPVLVLLLVACVLALVAGCGGSSEEETAAPTAPAIVETASVTTTAEDALPAWVEQRLAAKKGRDLALTPASSDFGAGENRFSFLVVRNDGRLVQAPRATVYYGPEGATDAERTEATLHAIAAHTHPAATDPHDHEEVSDVYVTSFDAPEPGRYWIVVEPAGEDLQAVGTIDVRGTTATPPVGSEAIASENPTIDDAPAAEITTARPPDAELLRYSVAGSLADRAAFVVAFATPKFCTSRTCGPTVDVVDAVRERFASSGIRFIHIEIYEGNDPDRGSNRWVQEWRLPSEPWVFLVDRRGVIRAKFEGFVSVDELSAAVREHLT